MPKSRQPGLDVILTLQVVGQAGPVVLGPAITRHVYVDGSPATGNTACGENDRVDKY